MVWLRRIFNTYMKDAIVTCIVSIYKRKGKKKECEDYGAVSLSSV